MTREEHIELIRRIREARADEGLLSSLLAELSEDYITQLSSIENFTNTNNELTSSNEKLRQHNYELFLKVGQTPIDNSKKETKEDDKKDSISEKFGLYK